MSIVNEHSPRVGVAPACRAVDVSRATWYRRRAKGAATKPRSRGRHPRRLCDQERQRVVDVLCSDEFIDRAPREVYATLLDRGEYLCSVRTMYRILAERRAVRERRRQRRHPEYAVPSCCATRPNELWSWDITKLAGPGRSWFSLYVILDVYSRYVVDWLLARRESGVLATRLIEQAIEVHQVEPSGLTIHADRGAPMTARSLVQMLADLGVDRSHSRPHVSNDNPFSEAQFKTLKYCPEYPGQFTGRHNHLQLACARQRVLDQAYHAHPERFVGGRPQTAQVPKQVWINRPTSAMQLDVTMSSGGSRGCGGRQLRPPRATFDCAIEPSDHELGVSFSLTRSASSPPAQSQAYERIAFVRHTVTVKILDRPPSMSHECRTLLPLQSGHGGADPRHSPSLQTTVSLQGRAELSLHVA